MCHLSGRLAVVACAQHLPHHMPHAACGEYFTAAMSADADVSIYAHRYCQSAIRAVDYPLL